jgi:hypothetical protein
MGDSDPNQAIISFGAPSQEEFDNWAPRACGAACALMVLQALTGYGGTLYDLIKELDSYDGFLAEVGWKHQALADALTRRGLKAEIEKQLTGERLLELLCQRALVMLSIKSRVTSGSHMVLVTKLSPFEVRIYDPYNLDGKGGVRTCSFEELEEISNHKGISVVNQGFWERVAKWVRRQNLAEA